MLGHPPIGGHEIHGPRQVRAFRHHQGIGFIPLQPLARLDLLLGNGLTANHEGAHVQLRRAIDAIDAYVFPGVVFDVARLKNTA